MTAGLPSISVIAPTYNRRDVVEQTLRHLVTQDYPSELVEVLLVDNSSDGTPEMARRVAAETGARIGVLEVEERLPAVKRNLGLRAADGDLVMFVNDDVWFDPRALAEHTATHAAHEGPIAVVGHVEQSAQMAQTPFVQAYAPFAYDEIADKADDRVGYRHFWSMNLSLPRQTMLDRNLVFHEEWAEIGHEDVELGWRWTAAGLPVVYNPRATGEHFHPHTVASACRLQASVGRGLRDLEHLVPDPGLLERYGVLSRRSSPRAMVRGLVREVLFNAVTVPPAARWLDAQERRSRLADWMYWKVLLHHTGRAYRSTSPRTPAPTRTLPAAGDLREHAS